LNNPTQANALNPSVLEELPRKLDSLVEQGSRAIVLHSVGWSTNFCSGLDVQSLVASQSSMKTESGCEARQRWRFREYILGLQRAVSIFEVRGNVFPSR
jgi:enoyl-CoA hydratase/carnithine racemase